MAIISAETPEEVTAIRDAGRSMPWRREEYAAIASRSDGSPRLWMYLVSPRAMACMPASTMNCGVGRSLSPNQKADMSVRPMPALAMSRMEEDVSSTTSWRGRGAKAEGIELAAIKGVSPADGWESSHSALAGAMAPSRAGADGVCGGIS